MRFTVDTQVLKTAVEVTSHATVNSNLTPILENILIDVQYKKVILTGNNLEMAIEYIIDKDIDIESEGKFTISSKFLSSFIALVQSKTIKIELEAGSSLKFTTDSGETRFKGVSAEKFPVIPHFHVDTPLTLEGKDLRNAIDKTLFSTAEGNIRPMLAGIFIKTSRDGAAFASTDSFRLSEYRVYKENAANLDTSIIIPEKTAMELGRIINDNNSKVELYIHENQLLVVYESIKLSSRLLSGRFPDYEGFFPKKHNTK
jgi:DNA polymerase-3 subunit beta